MVLCLYINIYIYIHTLLLMAHYIYFCMSFQNADHSRLRLECEDSFRADAFALQQLQTYQSGKLVLSAWVKRGFTSLSDVGQWFYNGNEQEAKAALERTRAAMASILELEDVPDIECKEASLAVAKALEAPMAGEKEIFWALTNENAEEEDVPQALPSWMKPHIDRSILVWLREKQVWANRFCKRLQMEGKEDLGPKMQVAYEQWLSNPTRTLVLDKASHSSVTDFRSRGQSWLKRRCILITIHMNEEPEKLGIHAGKGKIFRLKLLQGVRSSDELPEAMDQWVGAQGDIKEFYLQA